MPNGCLGSPVLVLLFGLDRGFLMDVGPERAGELGFAAEVEVTDARNRNADMRSEVEVLVFQEPTPSGSPECGYT
jgi:hypothetical protein